MNFAKFVLIFSCLVLCSCINNGRHDDSYNGYQQPYQQPAYAAPVVAPQPEVVANPYALEPPAYEQSVNLALTKKEEELFQKEKNLMDAQQELYEREKKLADREAAFIDRSKALDYKERNIENGRYYAPTAVGGFDRMPAREPAPVVRTPAPAVPATPSRVRRVEPPMPYADRAQQNYAVQSAPVALAQEGFEGEESYVDLNSYPQSAPNDQVQSGFIILQHPIQRDLVRCPATDDVCLEAYERLGYVRAENLSRFTAQDELDISGSYPTGANGQWRENNNIPRW